MKRKKKSAGLKIGDSVRVKEGVPCPDLEGLCIGGWQGRVSEIGEDDKGKDLICIRWDSITLKNMPRSFIDQSEEEGVDYARMYLTPEDVERAESRDNEEDAANVNQKILKSHSWSWLGEEGKRIQKVLAGIDEDDVMKELEAWQTYLENTLTFPVDAVVSESPGRGRLTYGDKVRVEKITRLDDFYGIIVEIRRGWKKYHYPLGELEVSNKDSTNYQPIKDYCVWAANC